MRKIMKINKKETKYEKLTLPSQNKEVKYEKLYGSTTIKVVKWEVKKWKIINLKGIIYLKNKILTIF